MRAYDARTTAAKETGPNAFSMTVLTLPCGLKSRSPNWELWSWFLNLCYIFYVKTYVFQLFVKLLTRYFTIQHTELSSMVLVSPSHLERKEKIRARLTSFILDIIESNRVSLY